MFMHPGGEGGDYLTSSLRRNTCFASLMQLPAEKRSWAPLGISAIRVGSGGESG